MWRRQLGYLLHPDIPVTEGTKIADVACGTGQEYIAILLMDC